MKQVAEGDLTSVSNLVSMITPKGSYYIDRDMRDTFMEEYCSYIYETEDPVVGLAEKPDELSPYMPVLVDVDLKFKEDDDTEWDISTGESIYYESHVKFVINIYQRTLREIVDGIDDRHLACFLLEKKPYRISTTNGQTYVKNGFHLHFPWIFLSKADQECHLIPRVQKICKDSNTFAELGFEDSGALIDRGYTRAPWLMYGSRKAVEFDPYFLTNIIDAHGDEIQMDDALKGYVVYDARNQPIDIRDKEMYYLPRILSIHLANRQHFVIKSTVQRVVMPKVKAKQKVRSDDFDDMQSASERIQEAAKLLQMISPTRAEAYDSWMTVIWSLHNSFDGDPAALELAIKFSRQCPEKFDESRLVSDWEHMVSRENGYTLRTLHHYAKLDSPDRYRVYMAESMKKQVDQTTMSDGSHSDLAGMLLKLFGNIYVCTCIKSDTWYTFENHGWAKIEAGITLKEKISTTLVDVFANAANALATEKVELSRQGKDYESKSVGEREKKILRIMSNLKMAPFKNNVMSECRAKFYNKRFEDILDKNKYLIRFKNGVYDLQNHIFRDGLPEDYCSLTLGVEYRVYTETDPKVMQVYDYFNKVFPDVSVRDYFMDISSDIFVGGNHHKKIWFWTGAGDNAKSVTETIFEKMMGEYAVKLPTSAFTGRRTQSSSATPEMSRLGNGVRWVMAQEPGKKEVFNIGLCKELSGNDTMYARGLYQEGKEIIPMFKLGIVCNDPPIVPDDDRAFWARIRLIPFEAKFCDDAPETFEEQLRQKRFPIDRSFTDKVPDLLSAFAWVLLERRKVRGGAALNEPEKVKMATAAYRAKNDHYSSYIQECLVEDAGKVITLTEVYASFKEWFRESVPNAMVPTKTDFKEQMEKRWGEPVGATMKWKGWRLRTLQDDMEDVVDV